MPEYPAKGLRGSRKEIRLRPLTANEEPLPNELYVKVVGGEERLNFMLEDPTNPGQYLDYQVSPPTSNGPQGPQGTQGLTGNQGSQGVQGTQGTQGNQGNIGPAGGIGAQGSQGPVGETGSQGFQGSAGTTGTQGNQGNTGAQGNTGNTGAQGNTGNTGAQGATGTQGTTGNTGTQGNTGPQGNQGNQGNTGTQGSTGAQGPQGPTGPGLSDGDKGDITVGSSGTSLTIDNSAVTESKIASDAVTNSKVSSSAGIELSKLASITSSRLLGASSSGTTVGQITLGTGLTMTGSTLSAQAGGVSYSAFKAADETTNTDNATYSNDTNLQVEMVVEGWYSIEIGVISTCTNTAYLGIGNVQGYAKISSLASAGYDLYNNGPNVGTIPSGTNTFTKISGIVYSSSYTTVRFNYYRAAGGNITIHTGSYLKVVKLN